MDMELLKAIGQMMDTKLQPIIERLDGLESKVDGLESKVDKMQNDLTELKEAHEITREGVNKVVEWADNAGFLLKIPFGKPGA